MIVQRTLCKHGNNHYLIFQRERVVKMQQEKIKPHIEYAHEHPWATVSTKDGDYTVSVSLHHLHYDEERQPYLLAFYSPKGEPSCETRELRLYLSSK